MRLRAIRAPEVIFLPGALYRLTEIHNFEPNSIKHSQLVLLSEQEFNLLKYSKTINKKSPSATGCVVYRVRPEGIEPSTP
jgi:hypothetical protein